MGCLAEVGYMLDAPARPPLRWSFTARAPTSSSLFCWALSLPTGTESVLLSKQHAAKVGIFACEDHLVITNETSLRKRVSTDTSSKALRLSVIRTPLVTPMGGKFGTALNSPIFIKAWHAVFKDAKYEDHDWTVKLDPDAVFVPYRVRSLLDRHYCGGHACSPMYISNFGKDLHGPVEVMNKQAMQVYALGQDRCKSNVHYSDKGEDWFLSLCLDLLGIDHDAEPTMLSDWHNDAGVKPSACDTLHAVFHPFKEWAFYHLCLCQTGYAAESCNAILRPTTTTRTSTTTSQTTTITTTSITATKRITTTHKTARKTTTSIAATGSSPETTAATTSGSAIPAVIQGPRHSSTPKTPTDHAEDGLFAPIARKLGRDLPFSVCVGALGLCVGVGIGVCVAWGLRKLKAKRLEQMTSSSVIAIPRSSMLSEAGDASSPLELQYSIDSNNSSAQLLLGRTNSPLRRGPSFQSPVE